MKNYDESLQNALIGNYNFTIRSVFSEAWQKVYGVKASIWGGIGLYIAIIIAIAIIMGIISAIASFLFLPADVMKHSAEQMQSLSETSASFIIFQLVFQLIEFFLTICVYFPMLAGILLISMRWIIGKEKSAYYVTKFWTKAYIFRFFMMWVLMMLCLMIPMAFVGIVSGIISITQLTIPLKALLITVMVLLILGSIYLMFGFVFAMQLIIDRFLKGGEALNISRKVVTYHWFKVFFLFIFMAILLAISAIPLGIPLIWTLPWAYNVIAIAYKNIFGIAGKDPVSLAG